MISGVSCSETEVTCDAACSPNIAVRISFLLLLGAGVGGSVNMSGKGKGPKHGEREKFL